MTEYSRHDGDPNAWITPKDVPDEDLPRIPSADIVIRPCRAPEKTKGGIILTDQYRGDLQNVTNVGRVVAVGERAFQDEEDMKPWCEVGDYVVYRKHTGVKIKYGNVVYVFLPSYQIFMTGVDPEKMKLEEI